MSERNHQTSPAANLSALPRASVASRQVAPCACADATLAAALEAVANLEGSDLEVVLRTAEAQRPGVRQALCAAFQAEAHRLADLSRRAFAAADRLAAQLTSAE